MERILKCYVAPGQPDRGWDCRTAAQPGDPGGHSVCLPLRADAAAIRGRGRGAVGDHLVERRNRKKNTGVSLFDRGFLPGQQGRSEDDFFLPPVGDVSDDCDDLSVQPGDRKFRAD